MIERGYSGFSFADIAERVEIRKPSIHHHFPTKASLGRAVVANYRQYVLGMLSAAAAQSPGPQATLAGYVAYWETCLRERVTPFCLCAMLAAELENLPAEMAAEVRAYFADLSAWLSGLLADGLAAGSFSFERPVKLEADCFIAAIHGGMLAARALGQVQAFTSVANEALYRLNPAG